MTSSVHFVYCILIATSFKLLLIPTHHSTDFEVHRNWLAITHSLPMTRWYFEEENSIWTLDYPPFFAYFEYILSIFAAKIDVAMLEVTNTSYNSLSTIYFQKISVIICDLLLSYASWCYLKSSLLLSSSCSLRKDFNIILPFCFVIFNGGLILVDNIHFQYNGYLLGLLGNFAFLVSSFVSPSFNAN